MTNIAMEKNMAHLYIDGLAFLIAWVDFPWLC